MTLVFRGLVELGPVVLSAADGSGVHASDQSAHLVSCKPFEWIVGAGKVGIALHGDPLPA